MATRIGLCLLALFVTAGLCRGGDQVPYKDRVEAVITGFSVTEGGLFALPFRVVRGQGTHVGRFTSEGMLLVEPTSLEFVGTNTITAANGDEIDIEILGALTPTTEVDEFIITVETTFVGGTGRFVNATGGFSGEGTLLMAPGFVGSTFTGVGEGTISRPNKK